MLKINFKNIILIIFKQITLKTVIQKHFKKKLNENKKPMTVVPNLTATWIQSVLIPNCRQK